MVGGNPLGDKFGFRNWQTPGAFTAGPLAEAYGDGGLGRFLGE
jgi:amino acid transporter